MSFLQLTHIRLILIALALMLLVAGITVTNGSHSPRVKAGEYYCVVIYDNQGRPINTTCVPWPL